MQDTIGPADMLDADATCKFFGGEHSPIDKSTLYRGIRAGRFPKPVKVGPGTSRWLKHECEAARDRMIAERDAPEAA